MPSAFLSSPSNNNCSIFWAKCSLFLSTRNPVLLLIIVSFIPPSATPITGTLHDIDSKATNPKGSFLWAEIKNNLYNKDGLTVEICDKSLFYVLGTKIDWKEDMMGSNFSFDNPVAQASCGGTSFTPQ